MDSEMKKLREKIKVQEKNIQIQKDGKKNISIFFIRNQAMA